ncbi:MAG: penicillin-binding protein 2 [Coriobacteriales bacterium]|jgi:penicillin-binding protein 2
MSALVFAIVIFIVVAAIVVVGIVLGRKMLSSRGPLKVDREIDIRDKQKNPVRETKRQSTAGDSQRSLSRRRINIFSGIVVGVLALLGIKVWSLQILGGKSYSEQAENNMTATASVAAKRGRILDRNGNVLVTNRASLTVVGDSTVIDNRRVTQRLSLVLGIPRQAVRARLIDESTGAQSDRTIANDVSMRAVSYIAENPTVFPGVSVETRYIRQYPNGSLAAHLLGYAGTISEEELANNPDGMNYESGDVVGKAGAEAAFESVLQGTKGTRTYKVNSDGIPIAVMGEVDPDSGNDVMLTIDAEVQNIAENALQEAFAKAIDGGHYKASRGAIIAMDVNTGAIIAMASAPTYDPNEFIGGISADVWDKLNSKNSGYPMTNRAIAGQYPAASTFKAFTGLAGLTDGLIDDKIEFDCQGTWTGMGEDYPKKCWDLSGHGKLDIYEAIANSCDVYFYEVASRYWDIRKERPEALQDYLKSWGFGSTHGIEIAGELEGRIPNEAWKKEYFWETPEDAQWVPGDLANMVIGQGDILVTPLQILTAYAGIATGKIPKPHVLFEVLSKDGQVVIPEKVENSKFSPEFSDKDLKTIQKALRQVVTDGGATSIFVDYPVEVAAKSGTGETGSDLRDDYAWFCGYGPIDKPQYACVCVVEEGGGGTATAGPAVRRVLSKLFGLEEEGYISAAETGER